MWRLLSAAICVLILDRLERPMWKYLSAVVCVFGSLSLSDDIVSIDSTSKSEDSYVVDLEPWELEWNEISIISRGITKSKTIYNPECDRYGDILPYTDNLVSLESRNYINASKVTFNGNREYIVTQAPFKNTFQQFYEMIWDHSLEYIVMVGTFELHKFEQYWPEINESIEISDFIVTLLSEELEYDVICVRKLQISKGSETRIVTHVHFLDWPDHGIPDKQNFLYLLHLVSNYSKMLVHCSAGVGRSGVFCTLDTIYHDPQLELKQVVKKFRTLRTYMVQSTSQYKFCYEFVNGL